jgi:adenylosuccinate synthase
LFLSPDAILCTDIERAEESLNRIKAGKAKGGTGRGISPAYAHYYEKTGLTIADLLADDWENRLTTYYKRKAQECKAFDTALSDIVVPDFAATVASGKETKRTVGKPTVFLERLADARSWMLKRKFVTNTFLLHHTLFQDKTAAVLFEGAQATGLDAWVGTIPDVTASNTSAYGVREGTGFWKTEQIAERIGIFKATYTSSVGARRMPTHIDLPKDLKDLPKDASDDQVWGAYVRETAHEYGTTTGRPRDITHLDLPFLIYNTRMSGAEVLAGTHLDIAKIDTPIKVCTHYTDKGGTIVPYQPGIQYQQNITPNYTELPGWDGDVCNTAKKPEDLPTEALQFLAFLEERTGYPIVAVTTGPTRNQILTFPGY